MKPTAAESNSAAKTARLLPRHHGACFIGATLCTTERSDRRRDLSRLSLSAFIRSSETNLTRTRRRTDAATSHRCRLRRVPSSDWEWASILQMALFLAGSIIWMTAPTPIPRCRQRGVQSCSTRLDSTHARKIRESVHRSNRATHPRDLHPTYFIPVVPVWCNTIVVHARCFKSRHTVTCLSLTRAISRARSASQLEELRLLREAIAVAELQLD